MKTKGFKISKTKFCNRVSKKISNEKLGLAINECQKNGRCVGVNDDYCDGKGEFEICEEVSKISNGVILDSCIYTKVSGMQMEKMTHFKCKIYIISASIIING